MTRSGSGVAMPRDPRPGPMAPTLAPTLSPTLAPVLARLATPVSVVAVDEAAALWREATITLTCARPRDLDTGPSLPARLRGAMGRRLAEAPARADGLPRAFDVLYGGGEAAGPLPEWPRPFLLAAEGTARDITLRLRVFGFAIAYLDEMVPALFAGLEAGLSLVPGARTRVPLVPETRAATLVETLPTAPLEADAVVLRFETPLVLERRAALVVDAPMLVRSIIRRVAGLAAWMDIALAGATAAGEATESPAPVAGPALSALADAVTVEAQDLRPVGWVRHSMAQNGRAIPMTGVVGTLHLAGPLGPLLPWLYLGARCHAGRRAALGLGRYSLEGA